MGRTIIPPEQMQASPCEDEMHPFCGDSNECNLNKHRPQVGVFDFLGEAVSMVPTCGFFITMNPGYAGRTELPENLKALFRSCAMIRPDLRPICENMLMAEGFVKARALAVKFVTLYSLSSELLSKQVGCFTAVFICGGCCLSAFVLAAGGVSFSAVVGVCCGCIRAIVSSFVYCSRLCVVGGMNRSMKPL